MRVTKKICAICLLVIAALGLSSCGGGSGISSKKAIKLAEQSVKIEDSAVLGKLPSIYWQKKAAIDSLNSICKAEIKALKTPDSESSLKKYMEKTMEIDAQKKQAIEEINKHYIGLLKEASNGLTGKTLPCEMQGDAYQSASGKILEIKINEETAVMEIIAEYTVVPTTAARYVSWVEKYADQEVSKATYREYDAKKDEKFTFTDRLSIKSAAELQKIIFQTK